MELKPIPVIGTAVVNGVHWLCRLIGSVDYPVEKFVIFNNNGRGQLNIQLDSLAKINHKYIKQIFVCHLPANIGCSGAWNLIIKSNIISPYWVIVNHDIAFTPGFLQRMQELCQNPETGMVFGHESKGYDIFAIKDWVVQNCGLFDENMYPAYCEDADYSFRCLGIKTECVNLPFFHGETCYAESGSQTWRTEPELKEPLAKSRILNAVFLKNKWGVDIEMPHPQTPYINPWNDKSRLVADNGSYDLFFNRKKYLGF